MFLNGLIEKYNILHNVKESNSCTIFINHHLVISITVSIPTPVGDHDILLEELISVSEDHYISILRQYGGASIKTVLSACETY